MWLSMLGHMRLGYSNFVGNVLSAPILDSTMLIQQVLRSDGGGCTVLLSSSRQLAVCGYDIRHSLCSLSCSEVITFDLEVLEDLFQNQELLVMTLLINL